MMPKTLLRRPLYAPITRWIALIPPDLTAAVRQRLANAPTTASAQRPNRLAFGVAILLIVLAAALLVSPVRARVLDWIRMGAVRIFFNQPTPTAPQHTPTGAATPAITPTPLQSVLDIAGETSLASAQAEAGFSILLPAFPPDLGRPDYVYLQQVNAPAVILVWMDQDRPGQVRMSLSETASDKVIFEKIDPKSVVDTQVNGNPAVWIDGNYVLVMRDGDVNMTRLVNQGHTLIWNSGKMTFRLEVDVDLESALRIAESIR